MAEIRDWGAVLTEYQYDLRGANRAPGTIRNYTHTLGLFHAWLLEQDDCPTEVAEIAKTHVARWIGDRAELESSETVLTRFRHLRAFFKWAEREEIVERTPMVNLKEPTSPTQPVPVLSKEQLRALFDTTRADKSYLGRRDYAMLAVLADSGVRVGELAGMKCDDLDFEHGTIEVLGKGRRRRSVPFSAKCGKALLAYRRARDRHRLAAEPAFWLGQRGPLREAAIWKIVRDRGLDAGIDGLHPHALRHTMSHWFRAKGGAEGDLQQIGGWKSPAMLQRYGASAAHSRAIDAHRRIDPMGDVL